MRDRSGSGRKNGRVAARGRETYFDRVAFPHGLGRFLDGGSQRRGSRAVRPYMQPPRARPEEIELQLELGGDIHIDRANAPHGARFPGSGCMIGQIGKTNRSTHARKSGSPVRGCRFRVGQRIMARRCSSLPLPLSISVPFRVFAGAMLKRIRRALASAAEKRIESDYLFIG